MGDAVHASPANLGMFAPALRHKLESRGAAKVRSVVAIIRNAPVFGEKFLFETVDFETADFETADLKDPTRAGGVAEFVKQDCNLEYTGLVYWQVVGLHHQLRMEIFRYSPASKPASKPCRMDFLIRIRASILRLACANPVNWRALRHAMQVRDGRKHFFFPKRSPFFLPKNAIAESFS